jgi:hypothetical protein
MSDYGIQFCIDTEFGALQFGPLDFYSQPVLKGSLMLFAIV